MIKKYSKENKIKVIFVVASLIRAGAETQVVNLINSLDNKKFKKYLFTYHRRLDQYKRFDHKKIKFYNKPRKNKFDLSAIKTLSKILDQQNIDIIHCTNLFSLFLGWGSKQFTKSNPRLIASIHTTEIKSIKIKILEKFIFQWLLRKCDKVIFVCKKQAEFWEKKYPFLKKNSLVIYNGIDTTFFNPKLFLKDKNEIKRNLNIPNGNIVLCCIARFRKEKAHEDIIEAFLKFKRKTNAILVLAGDGIRKSQIESLVKRKGLNNSVKFLGSVADVRPVLTISDISILASISETFPISAIESLSMGVPVVATDIGGLSEIIFPGKTGQLVEPQNPAMLTKMLSQMLQDRKIYIKMKKTARELVTKKFSAERMVSDTENLFLSIKKC